MLKTAAMPKPKNKGFTLIEVIVALSIFAVLSIIGYKGISSLIQTKERVQIEDDKWQQLILFFDRFELDIKQSVNRPIKTREDTIEPAWLARPSFAGEYGAQLVFSRFGDPEQAGFLMDSRRVGYRLHNGALELLIWPALDVAPNAKPEIFQVLPHVAQIAFNYLSDDGRWLKVWPEVVITSPTSNSTPNSASTSAATTVPTSVSSAIKPFAPAAVKLMIKLESGETVTRIFAL